VQLRGAKEGDGESNLTGYRAGPIPPVPVELWLGSQGPRMLALTGRASDSRVSPLNIYVAPQDVPQRKQIIDEAGRAAGRDPTDVGLWVPEIRPATVTCRSSTNLSSA
jgi:alkanesulfonate monooxygenase SsuD/methylene tetrahydromethanopterin reductase-like flavin-dependent oxidoreductase (luciferase family)